MRVLLVSSFVLPHAGGVEQFVATLRGLLEESGSEVRMLACRRPGEDATADAVLPTRFIGPSGWPLVTGGWRTLTDEVRSADAVVANGSLHLLTALAVHAARRRRVPSLLVIHGSGQGMRPGDNWLRPARAAFQRTIGRWALRRSLPVSVSHVGVDGVQRGYGLRAEFLPYPLPELPAAQPVPGPAAGEPLRVAWIGRLAPEKDPLSAVRAIDVLAERRPVTLDVYGDGPLRATMEERAATRPWLTLHGTRPWAEVLAAQERAHVCLSTSVWDNVQVAVLESLARGVPVVSTRVGDAPRYYLTGALARWCVESGNPDAAGRALDELAASYEEQRQAFAVNGRELLAIHSHAPRVLMELIACAGSRHAAG
jgi:glycosyltransferase involved in cell wall biosynthesis